MTQQQQNGSFQQPKMAQGLMVEDDIEFPLSLFTIPRCYQEDLSAVLIPYGLIQDRIRKLAQEIYVQIGDQPLTMICVLKGSFRFFTHLLEQISEMRWNCQSPIQVEFIRAQSYMDQGSTGSLSIVGLEALEKGTNALKAKQVLLVDDIIDTGLTISKLSAELRQKIGQDGRLWTALLVSKRTDQRMPMDSCRADFVAFNIPNKFIVGYGMDYNQMFRDLSHICVMNQRGIKKYATAEPNVYAASASASSPSSHSSILDNGVIGDPLVDCMEDRVKLTFRTQRPFTGRIFVKGMVENDKCVNNYEQNSRAQVEFELTNGQCNMRRSRKLGPEQRGVEQSITVIISFHDIFITKVDRAYRCTCFYMEADKVVTNRFDVSMIPTTELIDTARMPLCTYTVRRGSVNGPIVTYATVGEPVFHVWQCDSDMFSMLVHNCFVDDGAGKDRKPLIDEHGCTIDPVIVSELTYNSQANLAFSEVNVFKFADKVTTYFQCAVSTCMISEGMCSGKTPPHCGPNSRRRRTIVDGRSKEHFGNKMDQSTAVPFPGDDLYTMDLSAEKIVVLDLDDSSGAEPEDSKGSGKRELLNWKETVGSSNQGQAVLVAASRLGLSSPEFASPLHSSICFSETIFGAILTTAGFLIFGAFSATGLLLWRQHRKAKSSWTR